MKTAVWVFIGILCLLGAFIVTASPEDGVAMAKTESALTTAGSADLVALEASSAVDASLATEVDRLRRYRRGRGRKNRRGARRGRKNGRAGKRGGKRAFARRGGKRAGARRGGKRAGAKRSKFSATAAIQRAMAKHRARCKNTCTNKAKKMFSKKTKAAKRGTRRNFRRRGVRRGGRRNFRRRGVRRNFRRKAGKRFGKRRFGRKAGKRFGKRRFGRKGGKRRFGRRFGRKGGKRRFGRKGGKGGKRRFGRKGGKGGKGGKRRFGRKGGKRRFGRKGGKRFARKGGKGKKFVNKASAALKATLSKIAKAKCSCKQYITAARQKLQVAKSRRVASGARAQRAQFVKKLEASATKAQTNAVAVKQAAQVAAEQRALVKEQAVKVLNGVNISQTARDTIMQRLSGEMKANIAKTTTAALPKHTGVAKGTQSNLDKAMLRVARASNTLNKLKGKITAMKKALSSEELKKTIQRESEGAIKNYLNTAGIGPERLSKPQGKISQWVPSDLVSQHKLYKYYATAEKPVYLGALNAADETSKNAYQLHSDTLTFLEDDQIAHNQAAALRKAQVASRR